MTEQAIIAITHLAESGYWDSVKEDYLEPLIKEVKDVSIPIQFGDQQLSLKDSLAPKLIAARFLENIIEDVDRYKKVGRKVSVDSYK